MSNQRRPTIAVTGPNSTGTMAWIFTALSIKIAGGYPVRVKPNDFDGNLEYDGYVIGGGSDIHPENRYAEPVPEVKRATLLKLKEAAMFPMEFLARFSDTSYDPERDEMEKKFISYALQKGKPLLGICRGHQLLNSLLGGSMYTSTLPLLGNKPRIRSVFPRKDVVYVKNKSLINKIAGDDPLHVNAIHSQAIAEPAPSLEVTGKEEEAGINQVLESKQSDKVLGVQWHPEYLFYMQAHRNIFHWLVEEAGDENKK